MMSNTMTLALAVAATAFAGGFATLPATAQPGHCPPGLAKKNPPCVPPGQVGRRGGDDRDGRRDGRHEERHGTRWGSDREDAYREGYRDGYRVAVGDAYRRDEYRLVRDPRRYGLGPYDGADWRYYVLRDMIVRADPDTRTVLAVIGLADALLR